MEFKLFSQKLITKMIEIGVKNIFRDYDNPSGYILACNVLSGIPTIGMEIKHNNALIGKINKIENITGSKDLALNITLYKNLITRRLSLHGKKLLLN